MGIVEPDSIIQTLATIESSLLFNGRTVLDFSTFLSILHANRTIHRITAQTSEGMDSASVTTPRRLASTPVLSSPALTSSHKKEPSWLSAAKSSVKAFLSPRKSSVRNKNASPTRRRKSILGLYDSFRNSRSSETHGDNHDPTVRPKTASPSKTIHSTGKQTLKFNE